MKKKKDKKSTKQGLINLLETRIRCLQAEKQNFQQNPLFAANVRKANIVLIQNDIEALKKALREAMNSKND